MNTEHAHARTSAATGRKAGAGLLHVLCLLAAVCAFAIPAARAQSGEDVVVSIEDEGPEMAAAMNKARGSITVFWTELANPGPGVEGFAVKVGIRDENGHEFFWIGDLERSGATVSGRINNAPRTVANVEHGQNYTFHQDRIVDWMFFRRGKIVGNETMRPLLAHMPADQAAYYRSMLEKP